jgi:hypothetical protein
MSIDLHVFCADSRVPDRDAWQKAIDELGFATILDANFDVRNDTGFCPATYEGKATGFEFYLGSAADVLSSHPHVAEKIGARDKCATFTWGSDMNDTCAALTAAAALAKLADGIWFYPSDNEIQSADEAVKTAHGVLRFGLRLAKPLTHPLTVREFFILLILAALAILVLHLTR